MGRWLVHMKLLTSQCQFRLLWRLPCLSWHGLLSGMMHKPSLPSIRDLYSLHSAFRAQVVSLTAYQHGITVFSIGCSFSPIFQRISLQMVATSEAHCLSTCISLSDQLYGCMCWYSLGSPLGLPSRQLESQFLLMRYQCWKVSHSSSRRTGSR